MSLLDKFSDGISKAVSGALSKAAGDGFSGALSKVASGNISEAFSDAISQVTDSPLVQLGKAISEGDGSGAFKAGLDMLGGANLGESLIPMFSRAMEFMRIPSAFFSENVLGTIQAFAQKAENSEALAQMAKQVTQHWDTSDSMFKDVQKWNTQQLFTQAMTKQLLS